MTHRDRVLTVLAHHEPDRVPYDYWAPPELTDRLKLHLHLPDTESLLDYLDVDLRYVRGPGYIGQEMKIHPDGTVEDLWGVRRKVMTIRGKDYQWKYKHVAESPLEKMKTLQEIEEYAHWPSPDWWDYSNLEQDCDQYRKKGYAVVNSGDRLDRTAQLKPMMYLRGMEQTYIDMIENPKITQSIISHIKNYFLEYNKKVFESAHGKIDIFMMGDDFGTQRGPMISLDLWRKYFRQGFRDYIDLAHRYHIKVMHHTCGSVKELIPEFIDAGLDILQSIQPQAAGMNLAELKKEFGKYLSFHGSMDIQDTLPHGSPGEIRKEVQERMMAGKPGGGFIISTAHNIPAETPIENILILYQSYREFGYYS